jgi:mRNA-degrading endonuclease RelE of RelBE toxin-antitoxin system
MSHMPGGDLWDLLYDPRVRKRLERVRNKTVLQRVEEAARGLRERPLSGKPLRTYPGVRSLPVTTPGGEYRIIYVPIAADRVILVVLVAPREEVCKLLRRTRATG